MSGERQLALGREDTKPIVGGRILWPQEEGGLAEIGPVCDRLHPMLIEVIGSGDHGQRIALEWGGREHVNLTEWQCAHGPSPQARQKGLTASRRTSSGLKPQSRICSVSRSASSLRQACRSSHRRGSRSSVPAVHNGCRSVCRAMMKIVMIAPRCSSILLLPQEQCISTRLGAIGTLLSEQYRMTA